MANQERYDVAIQIEEMMNKASSPPSNEWCIYKVPHRLRKLNPDAYTPKIVSIGPYHHGNRRLLEMEGHKHIYCQSFIERSEASLDDLVNLVKELEPRIRGCYSENIKLSVEQFIKLIFVDCCFTIEFLLRNSGLSGEDDTSAKPWLVNDIGLDLILIENQIPLFVFKNVYDLAFKSRLNNDLPSFWLLASCLFSFDTEDEVLPPVDPIAHFTDLYRYYRLQPSSNLPKRGNEPLPHLYGATELKEAGVKFNVNKESNNFLDLQFFENLLRIPRLVVEDNTEAILRNIIAFEQCHSSKEPYFTDYIEFIDCLINTEKDVDILVKNEIIVNWLGDSKSVARIFNGLGKNVILGNSNTNYLHICEDLDTYCKHWWNRGKATLRHDYCNTPWTSLASFAAVVLLLLTITQTVFSILQVV